MRKLPIKSTTSALGRPCLTCCSEIPDMRIQGWKNRALEYHKAPSAIFTTAATRIGRNCRWSSRIASSPKTDCGTGPQLYQPGKERCWRLPNRERLILGLSLNRNHLAVVQTNDSQ